MKNMGTMVLIQHQHQCLNNNKKVDSFESAFSIYSCKICFIIIIKDMNQLADGNDCDAREIRNY